VISGYPDPDGKRSDTEILLEVQERSFSDAEVAAVSPWRFRAPLSPDMAARREGRAIDFGGLARFTRALIDAAGEERVLIEGVGGVCVPLDEKHTVLDWIEASGVPALLVAGSYLGTLSHTLSAVATLAARGVPLAGIVLSESPESPVSLEESRATLQNFLGAVPVALLPRAAPPRPWESAQGLADALGI
jgi:dethiobiotin synthetase